MQTKQTLREKYLRARRSLTPEERAEKSARIAERIAALPEFAAAETVLVYRATPDEADLNFLTEHPASAGKRFAYPVCLNAKEMAAMLPGGWREGAFGILEPDPASSQNVSPEEIGLVVCPGVAFDGDGTRLGMGGGYYDRFLPRCTDAAVLLAAFEAQRAEETLPREANDIPVGRIVTENGVY